MVVLKKVQASTMMETLVATVLIITVFVITSMVLNNIFSSSIKNNTNEIDTHLKELEYLYQNNKISIPYREEMNNWDIILDSHQKGDNEIIEFEATNRDTKKVLIKNSIETN